MCTKKYHYLLCTCVSYTFMTRYSNSMNHRKVYLAFDYDQQHFMNYICLIMQHVLPAQESQTFVIPFQSNLPWPLYILHVDTRKVLPYVAC